MIPILETALETASLAIGAVGVLILLYGVFHAVYRIIKIEAIHRKRFHHYEHAKRIFAQKIIFALDFFVAADLLRLAVAVNMDEIMSIAFIVAIRTVLSWSLSREVHLHKE
jgi:uncharacterized membrane protein